MFEVLQEINLLFIPFFMAGIILLIIEMYTPGFGAAGFSGLACLIASVIVGSKNVAQALLLTAIVLFVVGIMVVVFICLVSAGKLPAPLILKTNAKKEEGYISGKDESALVGKTAITKTALRPAGKALCEGVMYDVVSTGEFIDAEKEVVIVAADSNRISVKLK